MSLRGIREGYVWKFIYKRILIWLRGRLQAYILFVTYMNQCYFCFCQSYKQFETNKKQDMSNNIAIEFEHVSKQYRLGLVSTKTLSHDIRRFWITNVLGKEDPYLKKAA